MISEQKKAIISIFTFLTLFSNIFFARNVIYEFNCKMKDVVVRMKVKHSKIVWWWWEREREKEKDYDVKAQYLAKVDGSRGLLPSYIWRWGDDEDGLPSILAQSCTTILSEYWWLLPFKYKSFFSHFWSIRSLFFKAANLTPILFLLIIIIYTFNSSLHSCPHIQRLLQQTNRLFNYYNLFWINIKF